MDVSSGDSEKRDLRQVGEAFDRFEERIARQLGQISRLTWAVIGLLIGTLVAVITIALP